MLTKQRTFVLNRIFNWDTFLDHLKQAEFAKGTALAAALTIPLLVSGSLGAVDFGISMAVGVLLVSPNDVKGSLRRKLVGISASILAAVVATLLIGYAASLPWIFVPVLCLLIFFFSMLSVYGFRASMVSFSGLFALVLSMANVYYQDSVMLHALVIGCGGIWYLLLMLSLNVFRVHRQTEEMLSEGFHLTSKYLRVRAQLMGRGFKEGEALQKELLELQVALNENHELLREMIISGRRNSGRSSAARKQLLVFTQLVDILELSMANPVHSDKLKELFSEFPEQLEAIRQWSLALADQLEDFSKQWAGKPGVQKVAALEEQRKKVWDVFSKLDTAEVEKREANLVMRNMLDFKEKQYQKLVSIKRLFRDWEGNENFSFKDAHRFLTTGHYDLKTLREHLDMKSPIFRLSLRLTAVLLMGYVLGQLVAFQNPYWILLTSLVILRPGYALTQQRFKQRLYGTLIGGGLAVSVVLLVQNTVVYAILAVVTLILAISMIQKNYKAAAAFITLNVVFVYSLMRPDVFEVIQFRLLDTLLGAGLALVGNKWLWPTWEYRGIHNFIRESVQANLFFLKEVDLYYRQKGKLPTSYKLARKKAFLAIGDLNAAFQRMAQEPKTDPKHLGNVFQMVSLNQEFLGAEASLGTFIRTHPTTEASEHFRAYMGQIFQNLQTAILHLEGKGEGGSTSGEDLQRAQEYFQQQYRELLDQQNLAMETGKVEADQAIDQRFQELQIVVDQLKWLLQMSESLKKKAEIKEN